MSAPGTSTASAFPSARIPRRVPRVPGRLLAGAALVTLSAGGVLALVAAADRSEPLLVARHVIAAGDVVDADDLVAVPVHLGSGTARYLRQLPAAGSVATRTIEPGELVPVAALAPAGGTGTTSVVLAVTGQPAASVVPGARVDVWSAQADVEASGSVAVLAAGATVVRLVRDDGFGASSGVAVEVRVPGDVVGAVLQAVAAGAEITVLPAAG